MKAWLDGRLVEAGAAALGLGDRGFTLGDGLFETFAVRDGRPEHLERHLRRLAQGAALLQIALPADALLRGALDAVLAANGPGVSVGVLRLTVTRGSGGRGIEIDPAARPTLAVTAAPAAPAAPPGRLVLARGFRRDESSPLSRVKALAYLPSVLARAQARDAGADDALLPNTAGRVAGATVANLFALVGGRLLTSPLSDGPLPGIVRGLILETGLAEEAPLAPAALEGAEALLLTNSLSLRPAAAFERRVFDPAAGERLLARVREALAQVPPAP